MPVPPLGVPEDRNATGANVTSGKIPGTFSHMPLLAPEHCRREARVADESLAERRVGLAAGAFSAAR
jgi:hypothetical protein